MICIIPIQCKSILFRKYRNDKNVLGFYKSQIKLKSSKSYCKIYFNKFEQKFTTSDQNVPTTADRKMLCVLYPGEVYNFLLKSVKNPLKIIVGISEYKSM